MAVQRVVYPPQEAYRKTTDADPTTFVPTLAEGNFGNVSIPYPIGSILKVYDATTMIITQVKEMTADGWAVYA